MGKKWVIMTCRKCGNPGHNARGCKGQGGAIVGPSVSRESGSGSGGAEAGRGRGRGSGSGGAEAGRGSKRCSSSGSATVGRGRGSGRGGFTTAIELQRMARERCHVLHLHYLVELHLLILIKFVIVCSLHQTIVCVG